MLLNKDTFNRIRNLFPTMPYNHVCYAGASNRCVRFEVGAADENSNIIAGIYVTVSQHFEIIKIERLYSNWGRYSRNKPVIREKIPIHPDGQQVSWRKGHLISCMGDMRHYEYNNWKPYENNRPDFQK